MVRPTSASGAWTGPVGVAAGIAALFVLRGWNVPVHIKTIGVGGLVAAAMAFSEMVIYGALKKNGMAAAIRPIDWHRVLQKLVGLWLTFGTIGTAYWLFPIYADPFYDPFRAAIELLAPAIVLLSVPYVVFVDCRQVEPHDAYVDLTRLVAGIAPKDWQPLFVHARGWAVKAFFLPLMFTYMNGGLSEFWKLESFPDLGSFKAIYDHGYDLLYLIDVMIAAIGYSMTLRVLGTQIKSAEPTLWGWLVCLVCYPPLSDVTGRYLAYDQDNVYWGGLFSAYPIVYAIWGSAILILVAIYAWSTVAFGLRFSNLTNRGIITHGPYRWVRHPAYLTKNLSWWMISVPFIAGSGDWLLAVRSTVLLGGLNIIYYLRAKTEERHLAADPAYQAYSAYIADHGLWAVATRLLKRRQSLQVSRPTTGDD